MNYKTCKKRSLLLMMLAVLAFTMLLTGCGPSANLTYPEKPIDIEAVAVEEKGTYTSKEEVAAYIYKFGKLPSNYITTTEAEDLGWVSSVGNLTEVAPGKSIGGNRFGNREGYLPDKEGRLYYMCDINYEQGFRQSERLVFTYDGLVYYTPDNYETFEYVCGEE